MIGGKPLRGLARIEHDGHMSGGKNSIFEFFVPDAKRLKKIPEFGHLHSF
jgi:hypothetical protein